MTRLKNNKQQPLFLSILCYNNDVLKRCNVVEILTILSNETYRTFFVTFFSQKEIIQNSHKRLKSVFR